MTRESQTKGRTDREREKKEKRGKEGGREKTGGGEEGSRRAGGGSQVGSQTRGPGNNRPIRCRRNVDRGRPSPFALRRELRRAGRTR